MKLVNRIAFGLACALAGTAFADTTLTVYTALEADQLKAYQQKFEEENPGIKLKWCAIRPASSPPSCWPKRPIRRPTW
ncbi:hypothetical protein [Jeongeupia sp. USM3]|uniref:hypothetical protein n=1 Tax=Jeongeupia sp. USM3 TaxID=1906741 RepID=UPI000AD87DA4|nr:hypothetical protein [Jeongeupia sp. USM3]